MHFDNTGTLYGWGNNSVGQLGDGTRIPKSSPIQIGSLSTWQQVFSGNSQSYAIKTDGTLWAWGQNNFGQLGDNSTTNNYSSPIQVGSLTNWKIGDGGGGSAAFVKTDGTLWTWGNNFSGELGLGSNSNQFSSPVQVGSLTNWDHVSCGQNFMAAVKTDGTLWTWGVGYRGCLGHGISSQDLSSPTQVGSLTNWKNVHCGYYSVLAVKTDGTLWSWGDNTHGQLGQNDLIHRSSPVQVGSSTNWKQAVSDLDHSVAVKTDGTLWSWGLNDVGQLGDKTIISKSSPIQITIGWSNWEQVSCGYKLSAAVTNEGTAWTWGKNDSGQLGRYWTYGGLSDMSNPVQVGFNQLWKSISCGSNFVAGIAGQIIPNIDETYKPKSGFIFDELVNHLTYDFDDVFIKKSFFAQGTLWACGYNDYGQLGNGENGYSNGVIAGYRGGRKSSPIQIGSLTDWKQISAGYDYVNAIKKDGTLWGWGYNWTGQTGDGTHISHASSPVQIGSLTDWFQISCGIVHTAAIKTDGTLWMWGKNDNGTLGDGTNVGKSSPIQIGSLSDWKYVHLGFTTSTMAIKKDGTLWAWGHNGGHFGDVNISNIVSSPIQIGSLTDWKQLACGNITTLALKADGTLWGCGYNGYGQIGDNTTIDKSVFVQIGTNNNWKQVACGYGHTMAIKQDGTLWAWGRNNDGQLGLGDSISRSSPTQVGSLSAWRYVQCGYYHTAAIKMDGTLWTWGDNYQGNLGQGDVLKKSSPVQFGSFHDWSTISCGYGVLYAIQSKGI